MNTLRFSGLALAVATCAIVGCSNNTDTRVAVSGTANLKGAPIKSGSVSFEPVDGQDSRGGAAITDGKFDIPRDGGLKPGKYLVRVTAGDGKTPADQDVASPGGSTNIVSKDLVPPDWNVRSKQQVTVTKDGPNTFAFDIK